MDLSNNALEIAKQLVSVMYGTVDYYKDYNGYIMAEITPSGANEVVYLSDAVVASEAHATIDVYFNDDIRLNKLEIVVKSGENTSVNAIGSSGLIDELMDEYSRSRIQLYCNNYVKTLLITHYIAYNSNVSPRDHSGFIPARADITYNSTVYTNIVINGTFKIQSNDDINSPYLHVRI